MDLRLVCYSEEGHEFSYISSLKDSEISMTLFASSRKTIRWYIKFKMHTRDTIYHRIVERRYLVRPHVATSFSYKLSDLFCETLNFF